MRKLIIVLLAISFSCTESVTDEVTPNSNTTGTTSTLPTPPPATPPITGTGTNDQKLIFEGTISGSGSYNASGSAKIFENPKGVKTLTLENFKSSSGPDLRVYVAEDKAITNFVEISKTVKNGDISFELPTTVNISKQKFVLIWCKQFSVLFGSSELKSK